MSRRWLAAGLIIALVCSIDAGGSNPAAAAARCSIAGPYSCPKLHADAAKTQPVRHIVGAWNADTPDLVVNARQLGMQDLFLFTPAPEPDSVLGQWASSLHMKIVTGWLSELVRRYECHRTLTVAPPPAGLPAWCTRDSDPTMTEESLLSQTQAFLQSEGHNPLVEGYWVLDDVPPWDYGSVRTILQRIRAQIRLYSPGRVAICGFGGGLGRDGGFGWQAGEAGNYSATGCDAVGLYVYSQDLDQSNSMSVETYDWSMRRLLPSMLADLRDNGWTSAVPFIGVGQAWGGWWGTQFQGATELTPTAHSIAQQATAFCRAGASGIAWYAWSLSDFENPSTPANSDQIARGIRHGLNHCRSDWSRRSR